MDVADGAQSFGSLLGGQIALSFGQHLITNHKLADRRGAQQRRIKVGMKLPVVMVFVVKRRAVPAHGVGNEHWNRLS